MLALTVRSASHVSVDLTVLAGTSLLAAIFSLLSRVWQAGQLLFKATRSDGSSTGNICTTISRGATALLLLCTSSTACYALVVCSRDSLLLLFVCAILSLSVVELLLAVGCRRARASLPLAVCAVPFAALAASGAVQYVIVQPFKMTNILILAVTIGRSLSSLTHVASAALETTRPYGSSADWASRTFAHKEASCSSFFTVSWLWPLLHAGLRRQLDVTDAPHLHPEDAAQPPLLSSNSARADQSRDRSAASTLAIELWREFGKQWLFLGVLTGGTLLLGFAQPLLLAALLQAIQSENSVSDAQYWDVLLYAFAMPAVSLLSAFVGTAYNYGVARLQIKVRFALVPVVFRSAVSISPDRRSSISSGQVTDLYSVDVQQIMDLVSSAHQLWTLPVQVAVTLFLLYRQVHWAFAAGAAVLAVFIPINMIIARRIGALTEDMMAARDVRLASTAELLNGILGVKQLAWEMVCIVRVALARAEELRFLGARKYLDALCVYLWAATPVLVSLATFGTLVWFHGSADHGDSGLSPSKVFTAVTLLNQLIFPLNAYAWVVTGVLQAAVSFRRMANLVIGARDEEIQSKHTPEEKHFKQTGCLAIAQGCFEWPGSESSSSHSSEPSTATRLSEVSVPILEASDSRDPQTWQLDLSHDLRLYPGQVVCLRGSVGSGKTALLRALGGVMSGCAPNSRQWQHPSTHCIYAPSKPWIRRATLRRNITEQGEALAASAVAASAIGEPSYSLSDSNDAKHRVLDAVLHAVAFHEDLQSFSEGLDTKISLQRLSGGQAARVGLARALFASWWMAVSHPTSSTLLLLDDPVAALDADTGEHVLQEGVLGGALCRLGLESIMQRSCIVIASHHDSVAAAATHTVRLSGGGHVGDVVANTAHRTLQAANGVAHPSSWGTAEMGTAAERNPAPVTDESMDASTDEEHREKGGITCAVIGAYLSSAGVATVLFLVVAMMVMQATRNGADWWLAQWTSAEADKPRAAASQTSAPLLQAVPWKHQDGSAAWSPGQFLFVFAVIGGVNTVATFFRSFLFAHGGLNAAVATHVRLLSSIVAAPMTWFHSTPTGRVVNRFSADQYAVDEALPFQSNILLAQAFGIAGTLLVLAVSTSGVFLLFVPPLAAAYWYIQHVYRSSISRELRRLDSVTRSPLFNRFEECTALESPGLAVLQVDHRSGASRQQGGGYLRQQLSALDAELHLNQRMTFANMAGAQWLGVRLQGMGVFVLFAVAMTTALQFIWGGAVSTSGGGSSRGSSAGAAGLALAYALPIVGSLQGLIASFAATEQEAVSAERIQEYSTLPSEEGSGRGTSPNGIDPSPAATYARLCNAAVAQTTPACSWGCTAVGCCTRGGKRAVDGPPEPPLELLRLAGRMQGTSGGGTAEGSQVTQHNVRLDGGAADAAAWGEVGALQQPLLVAEMSASPKLGRRGQSCEGVDRGVHIVLEGLQVSYAPEGSAHRPLALDLAGHRINIPPGSRVAVTGRTGSGKSTLMAALWRLTPPPVAGRVLVDGEDALTIPLSQLRHRMSFLPQSPVLLQGSVRDNLDPWHAHSREQCRAALRRVFHQEGAPQLGAGSLTLDSPVGLGGDGISSGTRQLLALARVLLEARPVVVVDEAAAAVDSASEALITAALQALPAHVTVIVVAHRAASLRGLSCHLQLQAGQLEAPLPSQLC